MQQSQTQPATTMAKETNNSNGDGSNGGDTWCARLAEEATKPVTVAKQDAVEECPLVLGSLRINKNGVT